MAKDPARVAAGKKAWAKLSPAKKAAVKARLRRVRPNKGGGGKAKPKSKALTASNPGTTASKNNNRKAPKVGAVLTHSKQGAGLLAPITDKALRAADIGTRAGFESSATQLRALAREKAGSWALQGGMVALDAHIDKKMQQATALSKGSVSAWAPEAYLTYRTVLEGLDHRGTSGVNVARQMHREANRTFTGLDPSGIDMDLFRDQHKTYRLIKHTGQGIRLLRSKWPLFERMTDPVGKLFGMLGGRW